MPATKDGKTWRSQFYYEDWQGVRHKKNKRGFKTKAEMADEQGISKRTLENAKKELGIQAKKINNSWHWELDAVKQR